MSRAAADQQINEFFGNQFIDIVSTSFVWLIAVNYEHYSSR